MPVQNSTAGRAIVGGLCGEAAIDGFQLIGNSLQRSDRAALNANELHDEVPEYPEHSDDGYPGDDVADDRVVQPSPALLNWVSDEARFTLGLKSSMSVRRAMCKIRHGTLPGLTCAAVPCVVLPSNWLLP